MAKHSRPAQRWIVYRNGQPDPKLQPLRIEESMGAQRVEFAELMMDPRYQKRMENYTPLDDIGDDVQIEAVGGGVKHAGIVTQVIPVFGQQGESFKYVSQAKNELYGDPACGVIMFNPNFPRAPELAPPFTRQPVGQFKLVDDDIIFNPEVDGLVVGNMHSVKRYGVPQVPVFLDPDAVRTAAGRTLHAGSAVTWTLSNAVYYLCHALNTAQVFVRNPTKQLLALVFRDSVDLVRNVKIENGVYLPEALDSLLNPLGYYWRLRKTSRTRRFFDFFRRGTGGNLVWLNHQRFGEVFDPERTNVEANGVTFDASRLVNRIIGRGSKLQIEITAELVRGWPPSHDNADREELKLSTAAPDYKNAYRKWVLNEGGDYIGTRPEIRDVFNSALRKQLAAAGYLEWMIPRRRKLLPTLTRATNATSPIGETGGIEVEYLDASGEWLPANGWGIELLKHEAGIYICRNELPEALVDQRENAKIRVTATIETDFRITAIANRENTSPIIDILTAQLELDGQFHWREITTFSKYAGQTGISVDDRESLQFFVDSLRDRWDHLDVAGAVALEGVDQHGYAVGDRIAGVKGKNINFTSSNQADAFPQVVGITYDIAGQKTILQLQRFRETVVI